MSRVPPSVWMGRRYVGTYPASSGKRDISRSLAIALLQVILKRSIGNVRGWIMRGGWILGPLIGGGVAISALYAMGELRPNGILDELLLHVRPDGRNYLAAKAAISERLFDPYTARFGEMWSEQMPGRTVICGTVNSKNRMGAYIGMQLFAYDTIAHIAVFKDDIALGSSLKESYAKCETASNALSPAEREIIKRLSVPPKL